MEGREGGKPIYADQPPLSAGSKWSLSTRVRACVSRCAGVCPFAPSGHPCVQITIQEHATRDICACTHSPIRLSRYEFIYTLMKSLRVHVRNSRVAFAHSRACIWQ